MTSAEIHRQLAPVAESISTARRLLDGFEEMVAPEKLRNLRLLVSELMTNAVMHGGLSEDEQIGLRVVVEDRLVRVEVHDGGPSLEKMPSEEPPPPEQLDGRGLYLVQMLSDRWGVEPDGLVCVWFEITDD